MIEQRRKVSTLCISPSELALHQRQCAIVCSWILFWDYLLVFWLQPWLKTKSKIHLILRRFQIKILSLKLGSVGNFLFSRRFFRDSKLGWKRNDYTEWLMKKTKKNFCSLKILFMFVGKKCSRWSFQFPSSDSENKAKLFHPEWPNSWLWTRL